MFSNIGPEARKFGETTSVRVIPGIINSKLRLLFVIWLLGVATCGCLILWQLSVVFIRFFTYPVNTIFVESTIDQTPTFPDIALCNNDPLVHENEMSVPYLAYYYA